MCGFSYNSINMIDDAKGNADFLAFKLYNGEKI